MAMEITVILSYHLEKSRVQLVLLLLLIRFDIDNNYLV
jgi:hypothetical protein